MKNFYYSRLLDIYGTLLTQKQVLAIDDYYNYDYSLAEIATRLGVSRQTVRTIRLQAEKTLDEYEGKLMLSRKLELLGKIVDDKQMQQIELIFVQNIF